MTAATAVGPEFYDVLLDDPGNAYLHDSGGPYEELYRQAAALVSRSLDVCDLGCGSGRFGRILLESGHVGGYRGVDFSPRMVEEARHHCRGASFDVADLRDGDLPEADVYVLLEVLEHLDDDLGLLERLPSDALVVVSVPSFDSQSHVRYFPGVGDARERYGELLWIESESTVELPSGAFFHLLSGSVA